MKNAPPAELLNSLPTPKGVALSDRGAVTTLAVRRWFARPALGLVLLSGLVALFLMQLIAAFRAGPSPVVYDLTMWMVALAVFFGGGGAWVLLSRVQDTVWIELGPELVDLRTGDFPGYRLGNMAFEDLARTTTHEVKDRLGRRTWTLELRTRTGRTVLLPSLGARVQADFLAAHIESAAALRREETDDDDSSTTSGTGAATFRT